MTALIGLMLPEDIQKANERAYSKAFIRDYIKKELLESSTIRLKIDLGVKLLEDFISKEYHPKKQARINQLKGLDLYNLVLAVLAQTSQIKNYDTFTSVTAQLASYLFFEEKLDSIKTCAEIVATLAQLDLYDLYKESDNSSWIVTSNIQLSDKLVKYIERSQFPLPLVSPPKKVKFNNQSGYYLQDKSVILGSDNHHTDPISLDVINTQNAVELTLDMNFISKNEEKPTFDRGDLSTDQQKKKIDAWNKYQDDSMSVYKLIDFQSKKIYFDHAYDKRGRLYPRGYHINYMGTAYKKASISFYKQEFIGVPKEYRI